MTGDVSSPQVLLLPGWQDAGPAHWLSRWQAVHGYRRVVQHDWQRPLRGDWLMQLEEAVLASKATRSTESDGLAAERPAAGLTLVAHGLGCVLVAAWAAHSCHRHWVKAALLVAPTDVEREALRPLLASWSPIPRQPLPFRSTLVGSHDDQHCSFARAQALAQAWGSAFIDGGQRGQLNAESGLGDWPQGHALLQWAEDRAQGPSRTKSGAPRAGLTVGVDHH